jgi:hypothetical protein
MFEGFLVWRRLRVVGSVSFQGSSVPEFDEVRSWGVILQPSPHNAALLGPNSGTGYFFFSLYSNFSNTVPDLKVALFLTDEASISATFTSALQQVAILCSFIFNFSLILIVAQKIFVWLRVNQNREYKKLASNQKYFRRLV